MAKPVFEIYPGQLCKKCGADLQTMNVMFFDESPAGSYLLAGACGICGAASENVSAKQI
jgi:hypothetical protein